LIERKKLFFEVNGAPLPEVEARRPKETSMHHKRNTSTTAPRSQAPPRPTALKIKPENIPRALKRLDQWVGWEYELKRPEAGGEPRWTKVPKTMQGYGASSTNPNDWASFDVVLATHLSGRGRGDGIGFVTTREDGFALIDLDHVIDLAMGNIAPWAWELVQVAQRERGSYCEISVSRTGLHLFVRNKQVFDGVKKPIGEGQALEIYSHSRFFTMSGWRIPQ
jgi:primase-polymerase (primpol)-like protein